VSQVKVLDKLLIRGGFLEGMEINSMQVLHDCLLERKSVVDVVLDEDGHELETREARRPPATFASDQLEFTARTFDRTHNDRLQYAQFLYRRRQRLEALVIEGLPWLKGVWSNGSDGHSA
jgi:hypothetical protein